MHMLPIDMTDADIHQLAEKRWRNGSAWERVAFAAIQAKRFHIIHNRNDSNVYLVRMWLSEPKRDEAGGLESADSLLLHYFCRGDDDASLHDHPWSFETEIIVGGYEEHVPPFEWKPDSVLGPKWDDVIISRRQGDRVAHRADHLHCVGYVEPGTMTLVRTGERVRAWGFHPPGQPWTPYLDFIAARKPQAASAS
jgi:hypothetical protein